MTSKMSSYFEKNKKILSPKSNFGSSVFCFKSKEDDKWYTFYNIKCSELFKTMTGDVDFVFKDNSVGVYWRAKSFICIENIDFDKLIKITKEEFKKADIKANTMLFDNCERLFKED